MEINPSHFRMLRLARLRGLSAVRVGEGVYRVPSHSKRKVDFHIVPVGGPCPCDAKDYCTHLAVALDAWANSDESSTLDYSLYHTAKREERAEMIRAAWAGKAKREDVLYLRACMRPFIEQRETRAESVSCPF